MAEAGIPANRTFEVLKAGAIPGEGRAAFLQASSALGNVKIDLSGAILDGARLKALAEQDRMSPFVRVVREALELPVDLQDFLYFLDDVIVAKKRGMLRGPVTLPGDRARSVGVLLHPQDIFKRKPRLYAERFERLKIDAPPPQKELKPARRWSPPSPRWTARYKQPKTGEARLAALTRKNARFGRRMDSLLRQLKAQGTSVFVESTIRDRRRGFLIYGSYLLGQSKTRKQVRRRIQRLKRYNREWGLKVPIRWMHPRGWRATIEASRKLADTYGVAYATASGAKNSNHYDGAAIDLWAVGLPRRLRLRAPDGAKKTFDLSAPHEPRDLNLTPAVIEWIEEHFDFEKLKSDYPHWNDRRLAEKKRRKLRAERRLKRRRRRRGRR